MGPWWGYEDEFVGSEFITKNHKGATDFSKEIEQYLRKEASYGAIIGPFCKNPFCCDFKISPLNTVIKKRFSRTPGYIGFELPSQKFYQ